MNDRLGRQARAFLATVDKSLPYEVNYNNAIYDAHLYRWNIDNLAQVLKELRIAYGIEDAEAVKK